MNEEGKGREGSISCKYNIVKEKENEDREEFLTSGMPFVALSSK